MASENGATLCVRLSNGSERVVALGEDDNPEHIMDEILTRQHDYEWLEAADGHMVRVEAIDEIWVAA